jgi:hypothetical protein
LSATLPAIIASRSSSWTIQRRLLVTVAAFDWNCPQHITLRYTVEEMQGANALYTEHGDVPNDLE